MLAHAKKAIYGWDAIHFDKGLARAEKIYLDELISTADAREGIIAFLEKRRTEMDRQIEKAKARSGGEEAKRRMAEQHPDRSDHLMCRTPLWGVAGFLGCAYFAWISFARVTRSNYDWPHDFWTAATYIVWILLLAGLALRHALSARARILRPARLNFVVGCGLTLWSNVPSADVRSARIGTGALWAAAALVSLTTLGSASEFTSELVPDVLWRRGLRLLWNGTRTRS